MDKEKYKNLIETLPKESEELWFEYNLEVNKILQENQKYKEVIDKIKKAIDECWYMDSENIGEQIFLKKCELKDILKEVE